jgi:hypothetical protein
MYPLRVVSKFIVMNKVCPHCHTMFEPEPGFYQGAMYVGYGITVIVTTIVGACLYLLGIASTWTPIILVIFIMIVLAPINYRYSRVLYLHMFGGIKYDPSLE